MSMVTVNQSIIKMLFRMNVTFSQPQIRHIIRFVHGIILAPGKRTVSNIHRVNLMDRDASCYTRFLKESPWNEQQLQQKRMDWVRRFLLKRKDPGSVGFLLMDDTCNPKHPTTSRIEGLDFHYSHSEHKQVWSHSVVTSHLISHGISLPLDFRVYRRQADCENHDVPFHSKVDLAKELIQTCDPIDDRMYVLGDSWYSNEKVISACDRRGFFYIGGLKMNAIVYPWGHRSSVKMLAHSLRPEDLHSVTVAGKRYDVFVYEGKVSKINNAQVILSWENGYHPNELPFVLVCTDVSLDPVTVLTYYGKRWEIETGYRYLKENQGFDQYQMRSLKAIRRFWVLQFLAYTYLEIQRDQHQFSTLGEVLHQERQAYLGRLMMYAYEQGLKRVPAKQMLHEFGLTA